MKLHGITQCDTVKKARAWLDQHQLAYEFHDFKKHGVSAELLQDWIDRLGWQVLVNKQGTTWRKLDPAVQAGVVDGASALAVMLAQPSVIKRPVLAAGDRLLVGFKPELYQQHFGNTAG